MGNPRIDELRRRVQADPASIAFAQLAEEYRRAGQFDEAVSVCRTGLTRHPGYLSARVTLGRALLELGDLDDAAMELQFVVNSAPENLSAIRGLAEIHQRQGQLSTALEYFRRALALASHDPELEDIVQHISRELGRQERHDPADLSYEEAHDALVQAAERVPDVESGGRPSRAEPGEATPADGVAPAAAFDFDTLLAAMGTPPAPAPVDALLDGALPPLAPPALPEPPDAAEDPFAALEADLRQYVPDPIVEAPAHVDEAAADAGGPEFGIGGATDVTPLPEALVGEADQRPPFAEAPADSSGEAFDGTPQSAEPDETASVGGEVAAFRMVAPVADVPHAESVTGDGESTTAVEGEGGAAPTLESADPVLDELERWLAVLQERAGTAS